MVPQHRVDAGRPQSRILLQTGEYEVVDRLGDRLLGTVRERGWGHMQMLHQVVDVVS
jgi:hypothetical protein